MSASAIEFQDVQKSFVLVNQLRAGMRPSSNDRLFSAG